MTLGHRLDRPLAAEVILNRSIFAKALTACACLGALACSADHGGNQPASRARAASKPATDGAAPSDTIAPADAGGWQPLISGDWTLQPGTEGYTCVRKTITGDLYVTGFEAIIPLGTHHTLLTMGDPNGPDGVTACNAGENRTASVFGSGVGTSPINFPDGAALKIPAGTQLLLNLHLFNTGTDPITGTSGTRMRTIAESDVKVFVEGLLAGTIALNLPPGETTVSTGYCTMTSASTLFAVSPHMHKLGIYEKITALTAAQGDITLFDGPYDFDSQSYHLLTPGVALDKGDRVRVDCTHRNTTPNTVTFGESTLSEMCFSGIYRYPADGSPFICVDPPAK